MQYKFTTSLNIIRDSARQYRYIPTTNSKKIVDQIIDEYHSGLHSFEIIGSYGSGKSSMLWAFEQTLKGKEKFFDISKLVSKKSKVEFLRFVGDYQSIINSFAEQLHIKKLSAGNQEILDAIHQQYEKLGKDGLLIIFIDELGKFLEYGAKHQPEKELYFIQQLAEFVNAPDRRILLLTTLHQNFETYSSGLNQSQKEEWKKVRGRLKEITFNEPVEQLLLLASNSIEQKAINKKTQQTINELNSSVIKNHIFNSDASFVKNVGASIFPLDFISGYSLTLALQRYGQNERSLFTFLESREFKSATQHDLFFNLSRLYDYLWANFYSILSASRNSRDKGWHDIKNAIERCESSIQERTDDAIQIVKVIGILGMFSNKGASINKSFLESYLSLVCNIGNASELIDEIAKRKIIRYQKYNDSYKLFEGTDVDIDDKLNEATKKVDAVKDVVTGLNKHFEKLPFITAKQVTYQKGTPRIFEFLITEEPQIKKPIGEIDGYINLVINENYTEGKLKEFSNSTDEAIVFGLFKNSDKIKDALFQIEKAYKVKSENDDDLVVKKEIDAIINHQKNLLRHYFMDSIFTDNVKWFYKGEFQKKIVGNKLFNSLLSRIANEVYSETPTYKNELVNRHKASSVIHNARKILFEKLVTNWNEKDLGFDDRFPPEKTIYISLLRENGIHKREKGGFALSAPGNSSTFVSVWKACEDFFNSTKLEKRNISELYDLLSAKPYKLKAGLLELWISIYLLVKKDDFALFNDSSYIPDLNETMLVLIARNPKEYFIKAFSLDGVKLNLFNQYREFLQLPSEEKPTNNSFIESIKPFLKFYRDLNQFSKQTKGLSPEAIAIREAIANSKDPEKTFFEDFPSALNYTVKELTSSKKELKIYSDKLKAAIKEIRTRFDELIIRIEKFICSEIIGENVEFNEYKLNLQSRYKGLKEYMMLHHQVEFYQRLNSKLEDKQAWLSSLTYSLIGKSLETIKDEEVDLLFDKLKTVIHELDNLSEVVAVKHDDQKEKVFRFEITAENVSEKRIVKIPKSKFSELSDTEKKMKQLLNKDKQLNIAILAKLLQEELKK